MKLLLDTHVLLWTAGQPQKLSRKARALLGDPDNALIFSAASLWEICIKRGLERDDFQVGAHQRRRGLPDNEYSELAVTSATRWRSTTFRLCFAPGSVRSDAARGRGNSLAPPPMPNSHRH